MRPAIIAKLLALVLLLVGVVWATRSMNEQSAAKFFAAFGIPTSPTNGAAQPVATPSAGEAQFNVCKTRVRAVVWPDGRRIEESKKDIRARWLAVDPTPREINGLDIEKWFSRHCEILVREDEASRGAADGFGNFVTFEFIDGTKTDFERNEKGVIRTDDHQFVSPDFDAAIAELVSLAQLQPVGP